MVKNEKNKISSPCQKGVFNNETVIFPDVFDDSYSVWFRSQYQNLTTINDHFKNLAGIYLHDFAPKDEGSKTCPSEKSMLMPKGLKLSGLPCPWSVVTSLSTSISSVHANYGAKFLSIASQNLYGSQIRSDLVGVKMPSEITFTGSRVASTWQGMQR